MDTKALREEFAALHTQATQLLDKATTEKRAFSKEEETTNATLFSRMQQIKAQLDQAKALAGLSLANGEADLAINPQGKAEFDGEQTGKTFTADQARAAVAHYCRTGQMKLFALTSGTESGVYIPKEVEAPYIVRRLQNPLRSTLNFYGVQPITRGNTIGVGLPVDDDSGVVGQAQNEAATSGTAADPATTGSLNLSPTLYSSKQMWFSNTLVGAQDFDVLGYCMPSLYKRIDASQGTTWMGTIKTTATNAVTTVDPSGKLAYSDWLAFEHALAPAYRPDAAFILHDDAFKAVRGLVDNNNRPIFIDNDPTANGQPTIHGKPVFITTALDAWAANKVVGAYVSADAIKILDAGPKRLTRYINNPDHPDQTGLELFQNGDFGFIQNGVAVLKTHA